MLSLVLSVALAASSGPAFIEDDYPRALAEAKKQKKLLFVDAWAPWCHTCIFMREHVLTQPAFSAFEKDVVFSAVDTEKAKSVPFLEKFPVDVWPTLFFVDPATEKVVFKWVGSADATQMAALLDAARKKDASTGEADALFAAGKTQEAVDRFTHAKTAAEGPRAVLSLLAALSLAKQSELCAKTANEQAPKLTAPADKGNALGWGLGCALELPESKEKPALVASLVKQSTAVLGLEGVLADDMSGLYELLVQERSDAKDDAHAHDLAVKWLAFLDAQAAKAKTPAARAVFDPHRVSAALAVGTPQVMVEPLLRSEKDFPADYNPPARLAVIYRELGKADEALLEIDRALSKCDGPRKLRLYETKASIFAKLHKVTEQKATLEQAVAYARALPGPQRSARRIADLEQALAGVK